MLSKEEVKILLKGRKIMESIEKIDLVELQEKLEKIKPDKLKEMKKEDIIKARDEVDALYEREKQLIVKAEEDIKALGFEGFEVFMEYNNKVCREEFFEIISCSRGKLCTDCPTRACEKFWEDKTCENRPFVSIPDDLTAEQWWKDAGEFVFACYYNGLKKFCPEGYGWIYTVKRRALFDIKWGVVIPPLTFWKLPKGNYIYNGDINN